MTHALDSFFAAWSMGNAAERSATIDGAIAKDCVYSDPRSGAPLTGLDAISDYVGAFSANAPGWTATVETSDTVNGYVRATVAFGGNGPDGSDMVQHGTYFAQTTDQGKLTLIAGFVGTGA